MADRLNGYRILILETREEAQFSKLLTEQGAGVLQCPMFTIEDVPDPAPVEAWIRGAIEHPFDDLVLMTGAASTISAIVNIGHCSTSAPCSVSSFENCASSRVSRIRMR